jgi:8-oxo-dGTP pyrophosphatase MutT (NUDIX family)
VSRVAPGPDPPSPAADAQAPYVRVAVVGIIGRDGGADGTDGIGDPSATRWLLLHRVQPFDAWDPPGGRMEAGEDLVAAVRREVWEETGLDVEVAGPCYAFLTFYKGERLLAVSMACRAPGDPDRIRLEPEGAAGWQWATGQEWESLAAGGRSSWDAGDVKKATGSAAALWEAIEG